MTALDTRVRQVVGSVNLAAVAGRTLLGLDINPVPSEWDHISKVDPEDGKQLSVAFPLYLSETSAVSVGGSRDVTPENTEETIELIATTDVPVLHEPSGADHVTERTRNSADYLAIPEVMNGDTEALVGTLGKALDYMRTELSSGLVEDRLGIPLNGDGHLGERLGNFVAAYLMRDAIFEAYIIMNPESAAARTAGVTEDDLLSPQAARERALAAEYHLESEVVYLEYSGTFGGEEAATILEELEDALSWSRIWYGGGLDSAERAETVLDAGADAVVVGDVLHDIVAVEAELFERAREAFDDTPTHAELVEWVEGAIEVGETSATRYLSTIPDVTDAERRATRYLAAGVEFALVVEAIAARLDEPDAASIAEELREDSRLDDTELATQLGAEQEDPPRRIAATLLAERFDVELDDGFAAHHLGIELPE